MSFKDQLKASITVSQRSAGLEEVEHVLQDALAALTESLDGSDATVTLEIGHTVNYGVQMNIVIGIEGRRFRDILFRAYVPLDGYPVRLDLFGEELDMCEDKTALEAKILEFFREPEVSYRIEMYKGV